MDMSRMTVTEPDINIQMTNVEAQDLHRMIWEAKSYARDCGESIDTHDLWIEELAEVLDL